MVARTKVAIREILRAAGIDEQVISWIPDIIDTCRACRAWQAPKVSPQTTIDLPCKQNEYLEADIMFYKIVQVLHMLDQADRWDNDTEVQGKSSAELKEAISTTWLQICGPFKYLMIDGEKGVSSKETVDFLKSFLHVS